MCIISKCFFFCAQGATGINHSLHLGVYFWVRWEWGGVPFGRIRPPCKYWWWMDGHWDCFNNKTVSNIHIYIMIYIYMYVSDRNMFWMCKTVYMYTCTYYLLWTFVFVGPPTTNNHACLHHTHLWHVVGCHWGKVEVEIPKPNIRMILFVTIAS